MIIGLFAIHMPFHGLFQEIKPQTDSVSFSQLVASVQVDSVEIVDNKVHGAGVCEHVFIDVAKGIVLQFFGEYSEDDPTICKGKHLDAEDQRLSFLNTLLYALLEAKDAGLVGFFCDDAVLELVMGVSMICNDQCVLLDCWRWLYGVILLNCDIFFVFLRPFELHGFVYLLQINMIQRLQLIIVYLALQLGINRVQSFDFSSQLLILTIQLFILFREQAYVIHLFLHFLRDAFFFILTFQGLSFGFVLYRERVPSFLLDAHYFELQTILVHLHFRGQFAFQKVIEITDSLALFLNGSGKSAIVEVPLLDNPSAAIGHSKIYMRRLKGGEDGMRICLKLEAFLG